HQALQTFDNTPVQPGYGTSDGGRQAFRDSGKFFEHYCQVNLEPANRVTSCQITQSSCLNSPSTYTGTFRYDQEGAGSSQQICLGEAEKISRYCGNTPDITTTALFSVQIGSDPPQTAQSTYTPKPFAWGQWSNVGGVSLQGTPAVVNLGA